MQPSNQLPEKVRARYQWDQVMEVLLEVINTPGGERFLQEEAESLSLPPLDRIVVLLLSLDPVKALDLFREKNPNIDLDRLDRLNPAKVAVACLNMMIED